MCWPPTPCPPVGSPASWRRGGAVWGIPQNAPTRTSRSDSIWWESLKWEGQDPSWATCSSSGRRTARLRGHWRPSPQASMSLRKKILPSGKGRHHFTSHWAFTSCGASGWYLANRNTEHSVTSEFQIIGKSCFYVNMSHILPGVDLRLKHYLLFI